VIAILVSLLLTAGSSLVAVTVAAAAVFATAAPAKAASGPPVLVVLVNGESTAPEAALLASAGYTVTTATAAALASMSQSTFQGYAAVVIGDPSSGGSCPTSWQPTTAVLGSNWEGWVTGNVAVLGTAPELAAALAAPGNTAAATLITGTAQYAAAQPGPAVTQTGLYLSLDCGYSTAANGTAVPLLSGVEGIGAAGGDAGRARERVAGGRGAGLAVAWLPGAGGVRLLAGDVHPGRLRCGRRRHAELHRLQRDGRPAVHPAGGTGVHGDAGAGAVHER
jgi:hypothetical protein